MKCLTKLSDFFKEKLGRCLKSVCPCFYRFCRSNESEYRIIKGFFGLILGVCVGAALHVGVLVKIEHIPKAYQYHVAGGVMSVFGIACALSVSARCILILVFPHFFGKNGRNTVTTFAIMYLMTGPVTNIVSNAEESARAISCTASLSFNHSKEMFELTSKPLIDAFRAMKNNRGEVKAITSTLKKNFNNLGKEIRPAKLPPPPPENKPVKVSSPRARKIQLDFGVRVRRKCDEVFEKAVDNCKDLFKKTEKKCHDKMKIPAVKDILCLPLKLRFLCNIIRAYKSACTRFSPDIDPRIGMTYVKVERLVNSFDKQYQIETEWKMMAFPLDFDKKAAENIQKAVLEEFNKKKIMFKTFIFIAKVMFSFTFVLVFVSAFKYNRSYLSDFEFDNTYLTSYFRRIDGRRKKLKKKTLLPLMKAEKKEYIEPFHFKMRKDEKAKCIKTGLMLGVQVLATILFICFDKLLYELLDIIRRHSNIEVSLKGNHRIRLEVTGSGVVAALFRTLLGSFDQSHNIDKVSTNIHCLPKPTKTDPLIIRNIILIWTGVFVMVYFEAFTLRLRRTICAFFHRKREKKRVLYMYNDLLKKRKGFLKFMRKRVKRQVKEDKLSRETGILTIFSRLLPTLGDVLKLFNLGRQNCLVCDELESKSKRFHFCTGRGCYFSYCRECWKEANKQCYACSAGCDSDSESTATDLDELLD